MAGHAGRPAVLRWYLPAVRRRDLAAYPPPAARAGPRTSAGPRPLAPGQLRRELLQSGMSILLFGTGMIFPWGLLQLGWARLDPAASGEDRAGDPGPGGLERRALLDQPPPAAYEAAAPLPPSPSPLHRHDAVLDLQFSSDRGPDAGQRHPAAHGGARLQFLVAGLGAAVQPVLQLHRPRQLRLLPRVSYAHWFAASRRHHLHHACFNGNYGFQFTFMDRLFRTRLRADAAALLLKVHERRAADGHE